MITGIFHSGSGLGNQLHRYVATRVLALDKGCDFSMIAPENFKGKSFMNLDMGIQYERMYRTEFPSGKVIPQIVGAGLVSRGDFPVWEEKTNYYNPEFNFIEDNTIIDGEFQDERYFEYRLKEIKKWIKVDYLRGNSNLKNLCVIGFRGGEFYAYPELGLPKEYFEEGIKIMKEINPSMRFEIHTDDPELARNMLWSRDFHPEIIHNVEKNWKLTRYARYAIVANSSFYILPRLLKQDSDLKSITIAPRYWARRNTKEWSMPQNYYKNFNYI